MELLYSEEDFLVFKIRAIAALFSYPLLFRKASETELVTKDSSPAKRKFVLITSDGGVISTLDSVLAHLTSQYPTSQEQNHLLEDIRQSFEIPLLALISVTSETSIDLNPSEKLKVDQQSRLDISKSLRKYEGILDSRTFLVGEGITIVDATLFSVLTDVLKFDLLSKRSYPSLFRWLETVGSTLKLKGVEDIDSILNVAAFDSDGVGSGTSTSTKWSRGRSRIKELLVEGSAAVGKEVVVKGWVRTARSAEKGQILFVELNDGSTSKSIQLVLTAEKTIGIEAVASSGGVHACISCRGLVVASPAQGQAFEIAVTTAQVLGPVYGGDNGEIGGKNYPMAKKKHSLEFLREKAHLRPRSKVFSAALRIRHAMAFATHKFFNDRGFVYVHTPLITGADCEGAGEQFAVTALLPEGVDLKTIPSDKNGKVDFSKDFFGKRCALTVSGQLNVETHACALSDVYTFGPTFRAENSHTARHLAEFWMIEPEICFADLADDMALAEDYVKFCTSYALENCADDIDYFENEYPAGEKGLAARLKNVVDSDFAQITYTEAVDILQSEIAAGKVAFERYPNWGDDLGSEHERYITEKVFNKPTIVINYPKGIKAFYMKVNDDRETVAAMDILVPKIGELIGGSQREDRLDVLEKRCLEMGLKPEDMWWYLDLRRYGTAPHAGFGLGFERLIMFVTGLENIRDVIPFPRVPGHADF